MKIIVSSSTVKIFEGKDCYPITSGTCLQNESFTFQIFVQTDKKVLVPIKIDSDLPVHVYKVIKMKGNEEPTEKKDDFYMAREDCMYPDLLREITQLEMEENSETTLFVEIPAERKTTGIHIIDILLGEEKFSLPLTVLKTELVETDLMLTHWFHVDGICNYYHLEPFSEEFYRRWDKFMEAYVKLGNNMLLIPVFTPPLDTQIGGERLTTQLVKVEKNGNTYTFDFYKMKEYILKAREYGIKYFELSHLFTQWGGTSCPKIMVWENGVEYNAFGWDCPADDERYLVFLKQFFDALNTCLIELGIKENTYIHLTDEPSAEHVKRYEKLSKYVRSVCHEIKMMDALSHYEYIEKGLVDLPAVVIDGDDLKKFDNHDRMLYYCVGVDKDYITNRYFTMPMLRTMILGCQLYLENPKGFLHWGYNFYNVQFSIRPTNPYEDTIAGGGFLAGDSFLVYPGEKDVEYSLRYFAIVRAFEDYRLLKTVEGKIGKEKTKGLLKQAGIDGIHIYPHDSKSYLNFRENLYNLLK